MKFENTSTHSREPITPASSAPQAQNTSVRRGRQPAVQRMRCKLKRSNGKMYFALASQLHEFSADQRQLLALDDFDLDVDL